MNELGATRDVVKSEAIRCCVMVSVQVTYYGCRDFELGTRTGCPIVLVL
jgi:hypothetical protein